MLKLENVQITVSSIDRPNIVIELRDGNSRIQFLSLELTPNQFANAFLHNIGYQEIKSATLNGLDKLGKKREHKNLEVEFDKSSLPANVKGDNNAYWKEHMAPFIPEGWEDAGYYGSRDSISYIPNTKKIIVRATICRWVDPDQ